MLDGYRARFDAPDQKASVRYILIDPSTDDWDGNGVADHSALDPVGIIAVLPGGDGRLRLNDRPFETGSCCFPANADVRYELANQGFVVALIDAASDFVAHDHPDVVFSPPTNPRYYFDSHRAGLPGHTLPGQQYAEQYRQDLAVVFNDLRDRFPGLPLWVLGHSNGTVNAIAAAIALDNPPDGLVLAGPAVFIHPFDDIYLRDLKRVTEPVLVALHEDEGCNRAEWPPGAVDKYVAAFSASSNVQLMMFSGGEPLQGRDPCTDPGLHYFLGIEFEVVHAVTSWIKGRQN